MSLIRRLACIPCLAAICLSTNPRLTAAENTEDSVKQAITEFFTDLNRVFRGNLSLMENHWSHAEDVT
ncbi:MAG: hypothetical protein OSA98_11115 [Rubripirellula sp.]|nr:hypothetical protein [Rubripirellula sp.]